EHEFLVWRLFVWPWCCHRGRTRGFLDRLRNFRLNHHTLLVLRTVWTATDIRPGQPARSNGVVLDVGQARSNVPKRGGLRPGARSYCGTCPSRPDKCTGTLCKPASTRRPQPVLSPGQAVQDRSDQGLSGSRSTRGQEELRGIGQSAQQV